MARRTPRMAATRVVWWARRSRRPRCRVAAQAATVGRAATAPARGRRLCFAAPRRRRHRHGRARRRTGAGAARADGRAGRDRDAEVRGLRAPQVPDVLRLRDRTRRRPADLRRSGRGQPPDRLPVDAGVRRSAVCVGSARLPKRVRDRICRPPHSDRCPRLAHRRAPSSARAPGSDTSSPRGRSAATAASTTRLLRSTTRRDASSPSPTPSGSSCETPPPSAAEPLDSCRLCSRWCQGCVHPIMVSISRSSEAERRHACCVSSTSHLALIQPCSGQCFGTNAGIPWSNWVTTVSESKAATARARLLEAEAVAQTLGHWIESQPAIWVTSCKAISRPLSPVRD